MHCSGDEISQVCPPRNRLATQRFVFDTVAVIERNANSIEDETLRTALLELADSLKQTDDDNAGH